MIWGIAGAFLVGAFPFSFLIGRMMGKDLRKEGSKNPGATNLYRVCGPIPGLLGLALDIGKGSGGVLLGAGHPTYEPLFGLAAIFGHVFSPFLGFRGGKGVATAAGAFGVLAPLPLGTAVLFFLAALGLTRYMAVASCLGALALAGSAWVAEASTAVRVSCVVVALLVLVRHRSNFKRLLEGREPKFRLSRSKA